MSLEKIWSKTSSFLSPLGLVYGLCMRLREKAYQKGVFSSFELPARVISIGNLTLGGEGKTPVTISLARYLHQKGHRVAVITRGYRGRIRDVFLASRGKGPLAPANFLGDEVFLMASRLPVPIVVGRDRVAAGLVAIREFQAEILILDDGFQHLRLKRDLDLILFAASRDPFKERVFPAGRLREPLTALSRAKAFLITKINQDLQAGKTLAARLKGFQKPIFEIPFEAKAPYKLEDFGSPSAPSLSLSGKALAFCGLAQPESFFKTLETLGLEIERVVFSDHQAYTEQEIEYLLSRKEKTGADLLITTEKDAVKLLPFAQRLKPCLVVPIEAKLAGDFRRFIEENL